MKKLVQTDNWMAKSSPKSKFQIPNPKSKGKGLGLGLTL